MKAIVYNQYGSPDVLEFEDIELPDMGPDTVLVGVRAASLNPWDWRFLRGDPFLARMVTGLRQPKPGTIPGSDVSGVVEAVGESVTEFRPGDEVFAFVGFGGCAEYIAVDESSITTKPLDVSFEEAAAVPLAGVTALQGLRDVGRLESGMHVLVNGASGGVGTFAVQIAKTLGAEVTGVTSTGNVELVRSLGADHVIDYTSEDFTRGVARYDVMLDAVGNRPLSEWKRVMTPTGVFVGVAGRQPLSFYIGPLLHHAKLFAASRPRSQGFKSLNVQVGADDVAHLKELMETGEVRSVIDRTYELAATPDAIGYLEAGHVRGKIVIRV